MSSKYDMERTQNSLDFEASWRGIRTEGEHIPLRSAFSPKTFKSHLPYICIAEVDPIKDTMFIRLAGTSIRDYLGFELTGIDFNLLSETSRTEVSQQRRTGYHDHPFGRCELIEIIFSGNISTQCELTLFPLYGSKKERLLFVLLTPCFDRQRYLDATNRPISNGFSEELFIDIGDGIPDID